jgi:integrase
MSLYKPKKTHYWHYDFVVKGRRFHGSTGCKEKSEAKDVETLERSRIIRAEHTGEKPQWTLDEVIGKYWLEIACHQSSARTTEGQAGHLLRMIGRTTLLDEISDASLANYIARRRGENPAHYRHRPKEERPLVAPATINREVELLKRLVNRAQKVWKIAPPEIDWKQHKLIEADQRIRELTEREETALIENLREDFRPMVLFALLSGLRLSNVIRLTWKQVDLTVGIVTVRTKSKRPDGTTGILPLTSELIGLIAGQRGRHPIYVFTYTCKQSRQKRRKGENYPFSEHGWRGDWKKALTAAGIEDFRFHDLRHTFATRLLRETGNLRLVQRGLMHADITTTVRYAHADVADLRAAMEKVPNYSRTETNITPQHIERKNKF